MNNKPKEKTVDELARIKYLAELINKQLQFVHIITIKT